MVNKILILSKESIEPNQYVEVTEDFLQSIFLDKTGKLHFDEVNLLSFYSYRKGKIVGKTTNKVLVFRLKHNLEYETILRLVNNPAFPKVFKLLDDNNEVWLEIYESEIDKRVTILREILPTRTTSLLQDETEFGV